MASSSCSSPEISHAPPTFDPSFFTYASLDDVLDELSTRFIMNLPEQELASVERVCFQVEQAHWYYEDFMRETNPKLPTLSLKKFSQLFFNSCPLLRQWSADHEQLFDKFMHMKVRVPVCGAIMLNDKWDKCLLVKGWKSSAGWGFPKGKINQLEELHMCAIREVQEETGFDLTKYIRPDDYIKMTIREQSVTLFVVGGIPEDFPFQCRTRKEISKIEWFKLSDLPTWNRNKHVTGKFYLISPFIPSLKEFIRVNKLSKRRQNRKRAAEQSVDLSVKTDLGRRTDGSTDTKVRQDRPEVGRGAANMDRDAHGYSSSSADNGEPQTPSPQSAEAHPVAAQSDVDNDSEQTIDPHFARLINGLTLSAGKPALEEKTAPRASSVTPTSAKSNGIKSVAEEQGDKQSPKLIIPTTDESRPSTFAKPPLVVQQTAPLRATRPQSAQSVTHPTMDRQLKHLALLESVAQESAALSTLQVVGAQLRPMPPGAPPIFGRENGLLPPPISNRPTFPHTNHISAVRGPPVNDPFIVRSRTSQAIFPPSQTPQQRHVSGLSSGNLLSILNVSRNGIPQAQRPFLVPPTHNNFGGGPGLRPPVGASPQPSSMQQMPPQAFAQPHAVMPSGPPATSMLRFAQLGPSASMGVPGQMMVPNHPMMHGPGALPSPNKVHLLSLLASNDVGRHMPTLPADALRSTYPSGTSVFQTPGVSNNIGA